MDRRTKYLLKLWNDFRHHRRKFPTDPGQLLQPQTTHLSLRDHQLARSREKIETGLLILLQSRNLDDGDGGLIEQADPAKFPQILDSLASLVLSLDRIANEHFNPPSGPSASLRSTFQSKGQCARLKRVLWIMEHSPGSFELASGTRKSVFKINRDDAKNVEKNIETLKTLLGPIQITLDSSTSRAPEAYTPPKSSAAPNWIKSFDKKYGQFLERMLDSFKSSLKACDSGPHDMMIQLPHVLSHDLPVPEAGLDVFLSCKKTQLGAWQNVRCQPKQTGATNPPCESICAMVDTTLRRNDGLIVTFEDGPERDSSGFTKSFKRLNRPSHLPSNESKNLHGLIAEGNTFSRPQPQSVPTFTFWQKRVLIAKLAINLLIFSSLKHTSKSWDGTSVTFLGSSSAELPQQSPYVSCDVGSDSRNLFCPKDDVARVDCLTQFAKLILEIEYGEPIPGDFNHENSYGYDTLDEYHRKLKADGELGKENFLAAVSACLEFDMEFRRMKAQAELTGCGRDDEYEISSTLIRTEIVRNILEDLPEFREPVQKRGRSSLPSERDDTIPVRLSNPPRTGPAVRFSVTTTQADRSISRESDRSGPSGSIIDTVVSAFQQSGGQGVLGQTSGNVEGDPVGDLFPGSRSCSGTWRPESAESAKQWFGELNKFLDRMGMGRRQDSRRIKVAVLDTGLDECHKTIQDRLRLHDSTIRGRKSFIDDSLDVSDAVGHGTAVCDVLLRVAQVDLFVGKISERANFDSHTPQRVAKAIRFAASKQGWNADIIVLSFGFKEKDTGIEKAVEEAHSMGKIIIAAASNSGHVHQPHKLVSFPARMERSGRVISIRCATGHNRISSLSARPVLQDQNFMTLGEGIKAAWASSADERNPIKYVSGTSFATPLAAGIAACVLEFSIQRNFESEDFAENVSREYRDTLWTCRGIRKIFEKMSNEPLADGARMILPAQLFNPSHRVKDGQYSGRIEELMLEVQESE